MLGRAYLAVADALRQRIVKRGPRTSKRCASATLAFAVAIGVVMASLSACQSGAVAGAEEDANVADVNIPQDARRDVQTPSSECVPNVVSDAPVPAPYTGRRSPLSPTPTILAQGKTRFDGRCALCHGLTGRGDGREGPFVPPAADLTKRLRPEDYLFWRISEGGSVDPFCTAMPGFGTLYDERARWELVAYLRDLAGAGDASASDAGDAGDAGD